MANRYRNCIWVVFGINMIGTIINVESAICMLQSGFTYDIRYGCSLHIFNSLSLPVSERFRLQVFKMPWYNGGTVIMRLLFLDYTFFRIDVLLFQKANRPVYSYRLSYCSLLVVDFHLHLGRTTPFIIFCFANWAQNLGVASIMF
jgi:cbb3-type cytochrome oxidase subunit 1